MASRTADLAVIGGGPAGLACAVAATSLDLQVIIVEAIALGGQLLNMAELNGAGGQPDGVTGPDLAASMTTQAMDGGTAIQYGSVVNVCVDGSGWSLSGAGFDRLAARAVVVAAGSIPTPLGVPGEAELAHRGISDCAVCDGPLYAGQPVVVVGGGEIARYEASHLTSLASSVTMLVPRGGSWTPSSSDLIENDERAFVTVNDVAVVTILGEEEVTGVTYLDADGGRHNIDAAAVFTAHRRQPPLNPVSSAVDSDEDGRIIVDHNLEARSAGIFAVGDIRSSSPHSVLAAIADGHLAAERVLRYLGGPE